jgi:hypothetical protein
MSQSFTLISPRVRQNALEAVRSAPDGWLVTVRATKRSDAQNRLLWQALTDIAEQVEWYGQYLPNTAWKDIFTASLRKSKVVPGIDSGTFVVTGLHTSTMTKGELSTLMDLIFAFGAERGVVFTDEARG